MLSHDTKDDERSDYHVRKTKICKITRNLLFLFKSEFCPRKCPFFIEEINHNSASCWESYNSSAYYISQRTKKFFMSTEVI